MPENVNAARGVASVPEARVVEAWARRMPWLDLRVEPPILKAKAGGQKFTWKIASAHAQRIANVLSDEVLVAERLGVRARNSMMHRGASFIDTTTIHLVRDTVLVHVEQLESDPHEPARPVPAADRLQPAGVRVVQTLLVTPAEDGWTVRRLAEAAEVSVGVAQRVLATLEQADQLVSTSVSTNRGTRRVRDQGELLDWLARQPAARPAPLQWATHLYGRNSRDVLERAADRLTQESTAYAVTGMGATLLENLAPTSVPVLHFWIDRRDDLASVAQASGMKRQPKGANVVLWSDSDQSATLRPESRHGMTVAPAPRVYLDLLGLPRGAEVAETYRRVRLGY